MNHPYPSLVMEGPPAGEAGSWRRFYMIFVITCQL